MCLVNTAGRRNLMKKRRQNRKWKDKPLHNMFDWQIEKVTEKEKSYQWLEKVQQRDKH